MKNLNLVVPQYEQFVDANVAAYTLNLPMYYLTNATMRAKLSVPHYHLGRMVRFKLSELTAWIEKESTHE